MSDLSDEYQERLFHGDGWEIRVDRFGTEWRAVFRVKVQSFCLATDASDEAEHHCRFVATQFFGALMRWHKLFSAEAR